jgi:hypothetical protein
MLIKDLEISKELSRKDLSAVRGGFIATAVGGNFVANGGGVLNNTTGINAPSVTAVEVAPVTILNTETNNVIASLGTLIL